MGPPWLPALVRQCAVCALLCSVVYSHGGANGWPIARPKLCVCERQLLWLHAWWKFFCCQRSWLLKVLFLPGGMIMGRGNAVTCLHWPIRCLLPNVPSIRTDKCTHWKRLNISRILGYFSSTCMCMHGVFWYSFVWQKLVPA